jgi:hypothetical protein
MTTAQDSRKTFASSAMRQLPQQGGPSCLHYRSVALAQRAVAGVTDFLTIFSSPVQLLTDIRTRNPDFPLLLCN